MKFRIALIGLLFSTGLVSAQITIGQVLKKGTSTASTPSSTEIGLGIKEALQAGITAGADKLSVNDGFMKNLSVKIFFPPEAQKVEKTLRGLGANKLCDDLILSLNRAAEDAAKEAKPIFVTAIKQMSIKDASNILLSNQQDAATQYFKTATSTELTSKFMPIIKSSLDKVGATKHWTDVTTTYNKVPFVSKINSNLNDYVTQKAISGLFYEVAQEELKLRTQTSIRNTPLLQKVFAYADAKK